jgi:hypothetical protein
MGYARRRVIAATVTLGSVGLLARVLMILPAVNDAVFGDLPRSRQDFARMCEDGRSPEPFPRAAPYKPRAGKGPHPWVVIEDGWEARSAAGTETREPDVGDEPDPDTVQLVVCSKVSGSVPGTEITCDYTDGPPYAASVTPSVTSSRGRYAVAVYEARTGDLVGRGTLDGDNKVACLGLSSAGSTDPLYTNPGWKAYARLLADIQDHPSGS